MTTYERRSNATPRSLLRRFQTVTRSVSMKPHRRLSLLTSLIVVGLVLSGCSFMNLFDEVTAVAQTSTHSYPIVDTAQALTYDNVNALASQPQAGEPFYGQDAQVDGNQPSYQVNGNGASAVASAESGKTTIPQGDGTVTDLVTGLMWQQGYSGKMSQSQAASGASSFDLAGYSDWRLPTIKELYSLIDFSGEDVDPMSSSANNPFIDTAYFNFAYGDTSAGQRIIDSQWATTTIYVGNGTGMGSQMFGVNFADGRIKGYGTTGPQGEMQFYVRYVRGNTAYGENDFYDNGDGTISDLSTGLMWAQDDSGTHIVGGMSWEDALDYVQDLNDATHLGYSDWYLPNAKELQSIVDYSRSPDTTNSAAIDPVFNVTSITNEDGERDWGYYWTSTTHASSRGGQAAVYICFGRGLGYMNGQYVDVHGAGCQRSDPKSGSAIPTGRGPQGDVVRVANMVRVVRGDGGNTVAVAESDDSSIPLAGEVATVGETNASSEEDFVLFAPLGGEKAYLISRDGDVVNDWEISGRPGNSVYLTEGGNLLATYTVRGSFEGGGIGGGIELLTWDGVEVWSFELATDHAHLHHDVEMLPNGNVLMIAWESKNQQEALAAGLSANQLPESGEVWSEMILEYDPLADGIVWEWHLWDHALPAGQVAADHPEKIDLDYFASTRSSDWWHFNSVDYNEALDQIVISSRAASELWIIDHDLTTAQAAGDVGDLLYRFGNPTAYGGSGDQELIHQHDSEWLPNGNLLVFDNGDPRDRPYSRVVELDLPDYQSGSTSQARVLPSPIVWQYPNEQDVSRDILFANHISGAQRLESGNTLICSSTEGRFFEVTSDGEVVWEYVNPFTSVGLDGKESNQVFRAEAYPADFIGQALGDASSVAQDVPQNVVLDGQSPSGTGAGASNVATSPNTSLPSEANSQGTGGTPVPGIREVDPSVLSAGTANQMIMIQMDPRLMPPAQVSFSRVAIGEVEATTWTRSGSTIRVWFDIPSQMVSGSYPLMVIFPGRDGASITFSYPINIQ